MKLKPIILSSFIAATLAGCAGANSKSDLMARQISDLNASLSETNARVDDLNNKFMLLFEKIEASKESAKKPASDPGSAAAEATQGEAAEPPRDLAEPASAPEGLKVISLGEEAEQKKTPEKPIEIKTKKTESSAAAKKAPAPRPAKAAKGDGPDEIYNRGQDLFLSGKYVEARDVFGGLVKSFPESPLADNALYWAGETYYSEKDFRKSADIFNEVAAKYPTGNKAPDALLKAGFSCMELKDMPGAGRAFERLMKEYPGSEAAIKAKKTIEKLANEKK